MMNVKLSELEEEHGVRIEGEGSERARVAYASEMNGKLVYSFEEVNGQR
jgi:hypothetical protein